MTNEMCIRDSTWALRAMGIDDPQIGMNISLSYQLGIDYQYISDEFVLSGYYTCLLYTSSLFIRNEL